MSENGQPPKIVASFAFILLDGGGVAIKSEGQFPAQLLNMAMDVQKARMVNMMLHQEHQEMLRQQAMQKRVLLPDGTPQPPMM